MRPFEDSERIPLTVAGYDREKGTVDIIFQIVGGTTMELNSLKVGESVHDFVGPLGRATEVEGLKKVCVVGGGVGCAIALPSAVGFKEAGCEVDVIVGFRNKDIVILEDEKIGMRKLIARYPKLAKKFTSMINIPVFTNDELVNFAKVYTMENGFRIDQMGMLALYNLIGINQKEDQPVCIGTVKTMLDNAMAKAQGGLFKRSKKRVDRDGFTVLLEKDFS